MRYLLDTNILSNVTKPAPSEALLAWMAERTDADLFISSLTVAEIRRRRARETYRQEARPVGGNGFQARRVRRLFLPIASSHSTRRQL